MLKRAIRTLWIALDEMDMMWIPVHKSWRLNERHYGALQGLNKAETAAKHGEEQVQDLAAQLRHRRRPGSSPRIRGHPSHDRRYATIPADELPLTESLKDTVARFLPVLASRRSRRPSRRGRRVLIVAHGNSLRALVKYLDNMSEQEIMELNIPTGVPLVYQLNDDLKPAQEGSIWEIRRRPRRRPTAVANQGKAQR